MYIKEIMTLEPITAKKEMLITEALKLMEQKGFRRLPIMDEGKVISIVTDRDLNRVTASPATTLSVFELNYLLAKTTIGDILKVVHKDRKELVTVSPDDLVDEAALLMRQKKIGGLPVVENGKLVGIVTETDIFDTLIEVMGFSEDGERIVVDVTDDHPGVIAEITAAIAAEGGNIRQVLNYTMPSGTERVEIKVQVADLDKVKKAVAATGCRII